MQEFSNRVDAHRKVIKIVNSISWEVEPLYSLSSRALERWCFANKFSKDDPLPSILHLISTKLFLLAGKSQEQITEEYSILSEEVSKMTSKLSAIIEDIR